MTHRTYASQADEALRWSTPSPDARAVLAKIAERLRTVRPGSTLEDSRRLALILRYSVDQRPRDLDGAEELELEVCGYAPRITSEISRGEYALILDRAAGRA
ncbi:hypothetical protein ACIPJK_23765 [Streptomyces roseus]|uniref:hypothetical protein n=1 Tax=Streptomyces roseus TaxID=66430 RepID=UPI0037F6A2FD